MPSGDGATICGLSQGQTGSGMGGEGLDGVFQHPTLLGIYGCRLKSSYIPLERMTWEWGVGSQWEVWVKRHFVIAIMETPSICSLGNWRRQVVRRKHRLLILTL